MTVVVNTRDDFTLANFRRVSYDGEPVRLGDGARQALAAAAGVRPRRSREPTTTHPGPAGRPATRVPAAAIWMSAWCGGSCSPAWPAG